MNYYALAALLMLGAAGAGFGLGRLRLLAPGPKACFYAMLAMSVLFAGVYLALGVWKLETCQMGLWDFGIYDSLLHNAASGRGLMRDFRGPFDHFSLPTLLLLPFYWLRDTPYWLITFQALAMAAAAPVLYALTRCYFRTGPVPLVLAALYLLNPYYSRLVLFDFHIECLFPLLLFAAFLARAKHKPVLFAVLMLMLPVIKEDFVIALGGAGLYFLTVRNQRKFGALFLAGALFWTLFVLKIYYPVILGSPYIHYGRYPVIGADAAETVQNIWNILSRVFRPSVPMVALSVLLPFAFLPLGAWRMLILFWLPTLGIQLVSDSPHQILLISHYGSSLLGVTPAVALFGLRTLRWQLRRRPVAWRQLLAAAAVLGVLCHLFFADLPLNRYMTYFPTYQKQFHGSILSLPLTSPQYVQLAVLDEHAADLQKVVDAIPAGATVTVQNEIGCLFLRKCQVRSLKGNEDSDSDFWIFDSVTYNGFDPGAYLRDRIRDLSRNRAYVRIPAPEGIVIFANREYLKGLRP